ncbi:MAG: hypothetical protein U0269_04375 [Polyangiales bacterium]
MIVQGVYALLAWSIAGRAVVRISTIAGVMEGGVVEATRALRRRGLTVDVLVTDEMHPAIAAVLTADRDGESASDRADALLGDCAPPTNAMRGLATIGTTLGLLAAIATLRSSTLAGEALAAKAFGSALMGIATAIPLWTAIAIAGRHMKRVSSRVHALAVALDAEPSVRGPLESESGDE